VAERLADLVLAKIRDAADQYYRLVLVVAPSGAGKTEALQEVARRGGWRCLNLNLELTRRLLDLTQRQRCLQTPVLLAEITAETPGDVVLLDNTEILFDLGLKQDPLKCLQGVSRNRTVVASWNGKVDGGSLTYAAPGHPEYRRYPLADLTVVSIGSAERT
jgi:hypothetical protein